ncbi:nitrite reductase large subunit NirB [Cohnella luojiensis]|uniref:NAD(P)/FAD-dependent oxidoreductase n=1 Tax=Cohnella luojiensis TaxID=652876 RepID=A0A4Y8M8N4_9BACL|nr:nitrite reductase large subunit NirB [Cohnella luojiensis]TFE31708.1 NAD(P)/FAD-dependent oxidoreductase [Cohnella luojiensis]
MEKRKLVLIGNGMAGVRCVEEVMKLAPGVFDITIFGGEPHPNYNRIMLSKVLQGDTQIKDITINDWQWYRDNGITLHSGDPVIRIDANERIVVSGKGVEAPYDYLILATGSLPFMLPLPGADLPGVTAFRDINDCNTMMAASRKYKKAVVIGGGLLGLEAARGLLNLGMEVDVVHIYHHIMERQLDSDAAEMLRKELEKQGMKFLLGKHTEKIIGKKRVEGLLFKDGTKASADLIVMAVGVRPNVKLAMDSGIDVNRAIVVNDRMETNVPGIYAVGECAEHRGMVYGLVAPLYEQGKVLAKAICGMETEGYGGSILYSQLKVSGVEVFSAGEIRDSEVAASLKVLDGIRGTYKKVTVRDNRIVGAVLFGDSGEGNKLLGYIKQGADVSVLDGPAGGGADSSEDAVCSMSEKETVCSCNGVTKGSIVAAIREGKLETFEEVRECTRASSSCGGCKPMVSALLRVTLSSEENEETAKETVCACTDLSHEELKEEIRRDNVSALTAEGVREHLGWKTKSGCAVCTPALGYYLGSLKGSFTPDESTALADGTYSVVPRMHGGLARSEQLRRIANVIDKYGVPHAKLGNDRFELLGVSAENLGALMSDLDMAIAAESYGQPVTVSSCEGMRYDRLALRDSIGMAIALEEQFEGVRMPTALSVGVSGSPLHRAGTLAKDLGIVGAPGGWEIHVGGSSRGSLRQAQLLSAEPLDQAALDLASAFLQAFREQARYGETTRDWINRVGLVALREQLYDRAYVSGLLERLDADRVRALEIAMERQPEAAGERVK